MGLEKKGKRSLLNFPATNNAPRTKRPCPVLAHFRSSALASNFLNPLRQSLDSEKIFLRELSRQFAEKRTVAAAEIDLQRRVTSEKLHKIETRNVQFR